MTVFIIRRLMQSGVVILLMSLIVFFGVNVVGDPVDMLINPRSSGRSARSASTGRSGSSTATSCWAP